MSGEPGVWHSDRVASPAELILYDHCLEAGCVRFSEDAGIGAMVFPLDVKHLSEATLMEYIQGLQVTSISNKKASLPYSRLVIQTAL